MSAPHADHRKPVRRSVLKSWLRHVNTNTLALVMFVVQALLSATHATNSEIRETPCLKAAKTGGVIDKPGFAPRTNSSNDAPFMITPILAQDR